MSVAFVGARVPLVDQDGICTPIWYRLFSDMFSVTGALTPENVLEFALATKASGSASATDQSSVLALANQRLTSELRELHARFDALEDLLMAQRPAGGNNALGSFATGSVPFGALGTLAQDNAHFFWDSANKRLAVGGSITPNGTVETNQLAGNFGSGFPHLTQTYSTNTPHFRQYMEGSWDTVLETLVAGSGGTPNLILKPSGSVGIGGVPNARATLDVLGTVRVKGYTVATLPTVGIPGRTAYVTDALAPTFNAALAGGGAIVTLAFDNGANWVAA